jgi:hypothetical protein
MIQLIFSGLVLLLLAFALVTVITSDEWQIKHLPKVAWILLIIFLPLVGSILWFAVGREYGGRAGGQYGGQYGDQLRRPRQARSRRACAPRACTADRRRRPFPRHR